MKKRFSETLKEQGRNVAKEVEKRTASPVSGLVQREIALTIDHINRLQELRSKQLRQFVRMECYIGTDLMELRRQNSRYSPRHCPEEASLKNRLFDIEKQRRELNVRHWDKIGNLEKKLLTLLNQHDQLDIRS